MKRLIAVASALVRSASPKWRQFLIVAVVLIVVAAVNILAYLLSHL
jgi:hypothetical protein